MEGWTSLANAPAYEELFNNIVVPEVTQGVSGYISTSLLRRDAGKEVEFTTIFWCETIEAVESFAGPELEKAVIPDKAKALLSRWDETVLHYAVAL